MDSILIDFNILKPEKNQKKKLNSQVKKKNDKITKLTRKP